MNFNEKIWQLCRKVPKGRVTTYKELAKAADSKAYRAVGNAMNRNPHGILNCSNKNMVPCHRVVDSSGHLHGFAHGLQKKKQLLEKEGVIVRGYQVVQFEDVLYKF